MIFNIRGTSGSGKSTIIRKVMESFPLKTPTRIEGRKQPTGYWLGSEADPRILYVPGHYETACGGCDTLPGYDVIFDLVRTTAKIGKHVLFEGLLVSEETKRTLDLHETVGPLLVLHLQTDVLTCLESIKERRAARGDTRELKPDNTVNRVRTIMRCCDWPGEALHADSWRPSFERHPGGGCHPRPLLGDRSGQGTAGVKKKAALKFFAFARERHLILLKRAHGLPAPWTSDEVLRYHRFTNVFRELDTTTIWFRQTIRNPLRKDIWVVPATVIFRWFNRVETTGKVLVPYLLDPYQGSINKDWDGLCKRMEAAIREAYPNGPWVTGSYMVFSGKNNGDKLTGLMLFIRGFFEWWECRGCEEFKKRPSMERAHQLLMEVDGLSGFTSYEIVSDLRWTEAVSPEQANTWAHAGPGAVRGVSRMLYGEDTYLRQDSLDDQLTINKEMRDLLMKSRSDEYWPQLDVEWPSWELREVEHTLCEFDKYERIRRGQGQTKRRFYEDQAGSLIGVI